MVEMRLTLEEEEDSIIKEYQALHELKSKEVAWWFGVGWFLSVGLGLSFSYNLNKKDLIKRGLIPEKGTILRRNELW